MTLVQVDPINIDNCFAVSDVFCSTETEHVINVRDVAKEVVGRLHLTRYAHFFDISYTPLGGITLVVVRVRTHELNCQCDPFQIMLQRLNDELYTVGIYLYLS